MKNLLDNYGGVFRLSDATIQSEITLAIDYGACNDGMDVLYYLTGKMLETNDRRYFVASHEYNDGFWKGDKDNRAIIDDIAKRHGLLPA